MCEQMVAHPRFKDPQIGQEERIKADISKQRTSGVVDSCYIYTYIDQKRVCKKCQRFFYFLLGSVDLSDIRQILRKFWGCRGIFYVSMHSIGSKK